MFKKQAETIFSKCRDLVNGIKWFVGSDEEWNDYWAQRRPDSSDSSREKSEENVQDESKGCSSRENFHAHKMNQYRAHNRMPTQASSDESEDDFQVNQMKNFQSSNYGVPNAQASTDDNDMQSLLELLSNDNFEGAMARETSFETLVGSSWDDSQTSNADNLSSDEKRDVKMPLNVMMVKNSSECFNKSSIASENREESLVGSDGKFEDEMTPHCTFGSSGKIEDEKTPHHTFGSVAKSSSESHVPITSQCSQVQSPDFHLKTLVEMLENDKFLAKKQQLKTSGSITAIESFDSNFGSSCKYQHVVGVKSESDGDETFKMFSFGKSAKFWNEAQNGSEGVLKSENDSLSMVNKLIARFKGHDEISLHLNIVKDLVLKIEQEGWKKSDELDDQNENEPDVDCKTEENPNDETNETLQNDPDENSEDAETLDGDDVIEEEFFTPHIDKFGRIFNTLEDGKKSFRKVKGYRCWKFFCLEEGCEEADTGFTAEAACDHRSTVHTGRPIGPKTFVDAVTKALKDDNNIYTCAFCVFATANKAKMCNHLKDEMGIKNKITPDMPKLNQMIAKVKKEHYLN